MYIPVPVQTQHNTDKAESRIFLDIYIQWKIGSVFV